jgi:hypothetical protein
MNKVVVLFTVILIVALSLLAFNFLRPEMQPDQTIFFDDFENNFGNWTIGSQVPEDPNNPGHKVEWIIGRSTNQSYSGEYSVLFWIDGRQDDGTIWIMQKLPLEANSEKSVNISFQLWSGEESFNTLAAVVGYLGENKPQAEADFQVLGAANQLSGWKAYSFSSEIVTANTGEVYVALGISVRWETELIYFVDNAEITIN